MAKLSLILCGHQHSFFVERGHAGNRGLYSKKIPRCPAWPSETFDFHGFVFSKDVDISGSETRAERARYSEKTMIHQLQGSLRAWYRDGKPLQPNALIGLLGVDTQEVRVIGSGKRWQTVRLMLCDIRLDAFSQHKAPSEMFFSHLNESLLNASKWLSSIPQETIISIQKNGLIVDFFIEMWIDQDQFEIEMPADFTLQLGRLQISLKMLSND